MVERTNSGGRRGLPRSLEEDVCSHILRAAVTLTHCLELLLRPSRLSPSQYNALEVLSDAGPDGLACNQIAEQMTAHDPDTTRILDRLEARKLISRSRESSDRRVIRTRLTDEGMKLLKRLQPSVAALRNRLLRDLEEDRLRGLVEPLALIHENGTTRSGSDNAREQTARASKPGR
jgi:DNA-binding MarR family transcriptional regulator